MKLCVNLIMLIKHDKSARKTNVKYKILTPLLSESSLAACGVLCECLWICDPPYKKKKYCVC